MASDLNHWWGNDLALTPSGDLAVLDNYPKDNQRIVRRLCTNGNTAGSLIAEYVFHPGYGGAAPWYIGQAGDALLLNGIIRSQMFEEASVAQSPEPQVTTQLNPDGSFIAQINYFDAITGNKLPPLTFSVTN